jgi:hypothetical protein
MGIRYIHFTFQEMLIDGQSDINRVSMNNFIHFSSTFTVSSYVIVDISHYLPWRWLRCTTFKLGGTWGRESRQCFLLPALGGFIAHVVMFGQYTQFMCRRVKRDKHLFTGRIETWTLYYGFPWSQTASIAIRKRISRVNHLGKRRTCWTRGAGHLRFGY